jgi:hypothetical protein
MNTKLQLTLAGLALLATLATRTGPQDPCAEEPERREAPPASTGPADPGEGHPDGPGREDEPPPPADGSRPGWTTAVEPRPLDAATRRGLAWLLGTQREDGGWSQGEEAAGMRGSGGESVDRSNVADTCLAALALVRSGSSPAHGDHAAAVLRAVDFVCASVEAHAEDPSLWITSVRGTRVQGKIGTYIDTFLASMLLGEVQARMPDAEGDARVEAALAVVLAKIERNQAEDGTWDNQGWAPVLAQSVAAKGLNRLRQLGYSGVSEQALDRADDFALGGTSPGSAGVGLYSSASGLGALQEAVNTSAWRERELEGELAQAGDDSDLRDRIAGELKGIGELRAAGKQAKQSVIERLDDASFVAGFGSNGGEEFLSYMHISESLVVDADATWQRWDRWVADNLGRVQNQDGSWTGHHCITGRTFCTAAALLTLMADRTPVPVEPVPVEPVPAAE